MGMTLAKKKEKETTKQANSPETTSETTEEKKENKKTAPKGEKQKIVHGEDSFLSKFFNILPSIFTKAAHGFTFLTGLITNDMNLKEFKMRVLNILNNLVKKIE